MADDNMNNTASNILFPNFASMEKIMSESKDQFEKIRSEAQVSSRQSLEAFTRSGTLLTQGFEKYIRTVTGFAQSSVERQTNAVKQLMSCKTFNEVTETQQRLAQENFEEMMQSATQLSEIGIKLATEAFEPITAEMTKNVQKATDTVNNAAQSAAA